MQNIHAHVWDRDKHFDPSTTHEEELVRGQSIDMSTPFDAFIEDCAAFEKVVIFGLKGRLTGTWVPDEFVADYAARAPEKLFAFASCDPTQPGYMDELRRAFEELHLVGLKMGPTYAGFDPRDPRCAPVYEYCQDRGLSILFHTGTTYKRVAPLGVSRPWLFDQVAIQYPELRMVLAHVGHPFCEECLVVIRKHPHVYADIAAIYYRPWQFYNTMILAQEYKVTHKLLFGTDYPITSASESIQGVRHVNHVIGDTPLPRVRSEVIEALLERDAFSLLGIET